jgi:hypothetical protein
VANEVESLYHHHYHHKMVGFTLGICKGTWRMNPGFSELDVWGLPWPPPPPSGSMAKPRWGSKVRPWKLTKYSILSCIRCIKIMNRLFLKYVNIFSNGVCVHQALDPPLNNIFW